MAFEDFPEIEAFQKLPKRLIVKGGDATLNSKGDAELAGIMINNSGQTVRDVNVIMVLFNEKHVPTMSLSVKPDPDKLAQGSIASFKFHHKGYGEKFSNYYLYATWNYDDSEF